MNKYYVDVILPLAIDGTYSYSVPNELYKEIHIGVRVVVTFGKNKKYAALVSRIFQSPPSYRTKEIESVLDESPIIQKSQLVFWEWISVYYMCSLGEVMLAALPSAFRLSSESIFTINPLIELDYQKLSDSEFLIIEGLEKNKKLTLSEISEITERKTVYPLIKSLLEKRYISSYEEIKEVYRPKLEWYVKLTEYASIEKNLQLIFEQLEKAPKQLEVLMMYLQLSGFHSSDSFEVKKIELQKKVEGNAALINTLIKKNVFEVYSKELSRFNKIGFENASKKLNEAQKIALDKIKEEFKTHDVVLLQGVTSSGKTEVYVKLIEEQIIKGNQILYLLPEIALTTQLIERLKIYFGDKVGVYHSRFNPMERIEVWNAILGNTKSKFQIIVGARSSVFLPFKKLGLVIVDEEHDSSFKQFDPAPRYNAKNAAIYLGKQSHAKVLLGSATPSLTSKFNVKEGLFGYVEMNQRYGGVQMPEIFTSDLTKARKKKEMKGNFSQFLFNHIHEALEKREQVILFQNRRGFSPYIQCDSCGWVAYCINCDISLTYHKIKNDLTCHYCGYRSYVPKKCEACNSVELKLKGFGTEKIEEDIGILFPNHVVKRMDYDTTRSKNSYQKIIHDFESGQIDILVGTQMVTKGLDFKNVSLIGVLDADKLINFPDFRSFERAFQLITQVAGRAGRNKERGKVVIQTNRYDHFVIQKVIENDIEGFVDQQLYERKLYKYPPYFRLIKITLRHKKLDLVNEASELFAERLKLKLKERVIGPEFPLISKIRNQYNKNIIIKIERNSNMLFLKKFINEVDVNVRSDTKYRYIRVLYDVDPLQ